MKKEKFIILVSSITLLTSALVLSTINKVGSYIVRGDEETYSISLNSNNKLTLSNSAITSEFTTDIQTTNRNNISITSNNIVNNASGWQSLLPGGYFYNPITTGVNYNKINSIKTIKYTGSNSLELHYGYTLDNQNVLYTHAKTLESDVDYVFTDEENIPSYIYIKNPHDETVDISNFSITYTCKESTYNTNNLNILMIGNSFADDTIFYVRRIAESIGLTINVYDAYIGGCTIEQHYTNINSGEALYSMRSTNGSNWVYQNNMSLIDIVEYDSWDIITFQQASAEAGIGSSYAYLQPLVEKVKSKAKNCDPEICWHQTWAYDDDYSEYYDYFSRYDNSSEAMYVAIQEAYRTQVVESGLFSKTIFNGTAVREMRSTFMNSSFSRDGKHMSLVHGRYLLSTNFISSLYDIDFNLTKIKYKPVGLTDRYLNMVSFITSNIYQNPNYALDKYFSSIFDEYDLSNYTEIDAGLVGCSYWNCTDSTNYNKRNNHVSGTSNIYVSSKRFTPATLPVGSVVLVNEGLGYRPEAWVSDAVQSSREVERYDSILEIDEEFWNGYEYRAFNIFKAGKQTLAGEYIDEQYDDIFENFKVYVPTDKLTSEITLKNTNIHYDEDDLLLKDIGLDINDYTYLYLDPITGFYKCDSYYYLMNSYVDNTAQKFVCTIPFIGLPVGTLLILDSGYQYRSDCWTSHGTYSPRPSNVTDRITVIDSTFFEGFRRRTFNVSKTDGSTKVGQNSIEFINHFRIYLPK